MRHRFLQIHYLSSYPGSLLNSDDTGFAKRIPFGGVSRIRISSQCLKHHWRKHKGEYALNDLKIPMSVRSRRTFEKMIVEPLAKEFPIETVRIIVSAIMAYVLGESVKAKKAKKESEEPIGSLETSQITVLGQQEIDYLQKLAKSLCESLANPKDREEVERRLDKELKNNLLTLGNTATGLDSAMFGRMVTSNMLARVDAAIHVAHAFTVHAEATENDFFTAVDDLVPMYSAHISNTELTTGLYYGYVVVDLPLLFKNLQAYDPEVAIQLVHHLIYLIATVSPKVKQGATAPYTYANTLLLELGNAQPCTYANAFLKPVKDGPYLLENTYQSLATYIKEIDTMYNAKNKRGLAHIGDFSELSTISHIQKFITISDLVSWVVQDLRGAPC